MKSIRHFFDRLFNPAPVQPLPPGIYTYQAPADADFPYRLHLRLEPDGSGLLIVNASTVLHLNQTAAEYAYHLVRQTPKQEVGGIIARRYQVPQDQAVRDFDHFMEKLTALIETPDLDPVTFLGFDRQEPYTDIVSAPYRLDCALTYRTSDEEYQDAAPQERVTRELLCEEWKTILDKAWQAGIPHIIFTGGEPTLRPDLKDLVRHAEALGQVTGLLTDGLRLTTLEYFEELLQCGLDHLMIMLDDSDEHSWEAVRDAMSQDIYLTVHITLTPENADAIEDILDHLSRLEVPSISLSVCDFALRDRLEVARQAVMDRDMQLVWDLPVPYSQFNPVALELAEAEEALPENHRAWLYVEPDGDVLEQQGKPGVLGNLLHDPWEAIWKRA